MSTEMSCPGCGRAFEELDPRLFSFNSPHGWCEECGGFGEIWNEKLQQNDEETGDSMLENELDAERQFESVDEERSGAMSRLPRRAPESDRAACAVAGKDDRRVRGLFGRRSARPDQASCVSAAPKK